MKAKWSSKRGKTKYNLSIDALSIPAVVFFQKAKILVESDEKVTKNPLTEKSIGFNGKQTYQKMEMDFIFRTGGSDGPRQTAKAKMESSLSKATDQGALTFSITDLSMAPGFEIDTKCFFKFFNHQIDLGTYLKAGEIEIKAQGGIQSKNHVTKINGKFTTPFGNFGLESEWEVEDSQNIRVLLNPYFDEKHYPTQLLFKDNSGEKLDMVSELTMNLIDLMKIIK